MRVCVLYTPAPPGAPPEELDGLVQRDAVAEALRHAGHQVETLGLLPDLAEDLRAIRAIAPDCVFNLVEAVAGSDRLQLIAPLLLEELQLPYTGCGSEAMALCADKCSAKRRLLAAGLPTPEWSESGREIPSSLLGQRVIFKSRTSHASVGLDEDSLACFQETGALLKELEQRGRGWYAERFVDGREFNISLLAKGKGAEMLRPAEIDFSPFPAGKPRLVGYRAKWVEDSFEFHHTNRIFDFPPADKPLLEQIERLALRCWEAFRLRGYARVDFRVDQVGRPWILEINTNPCISPDAGFAAAASRSGLDYTAAVERILEAAFFD